MEIVACICAFEAEQTLSQTLESLKDLVDRAIVVDGSWKGFADYAASKDRTIEVAESFNGKPFTITVLPCAKQYESEMEKRSQYLHPDFLKKGDWIFIIDDDERITQGAAQARKIVLATEETHHSVVVWKKQEEGRWNRMGEYVRFIRYVPGMKYGINPWTIELPNRTSIPVKGVPIPLHIANNPLAKTRSYRVAKEKARETGHFGKVESVAPSDKKKQGRRPRRVKPTQP